MITKSVATIKTKGDLGTMEKAVLNLKQANEYCGISIRKLRLLIHKKQLRASQIGRNYYITPKALDSLIKDNEV